MAEEASSEMYFERFDDRPVLAICVRGLAYALAISALVLFWPSEPHVFIYQGF